jgi:hypothetical protein
MITLKNNFIYNDDFENMTLPALETITYDKVAVVLTGGQGGGGQGGGAGAKVSATLSGLTNKTLGFKLGATANDTDGGNASYLWNMTDNQYLLVAGGGGGWGGGDGLASVVLLKPLLPFAAGAGYAVTVNPPGAVLTYTDNSTTLEVITPGTGYVTVPTITITAIDTGTSVLLENGVNATIQLLGTNAAGGNAGGAQGRGGDGGGKNGGQGGSVGLVALKTQSGVGGMGGSLNGLLPGKSGASITQPGPNGALSTLLGGTAGLTKVVGYGGLAAAGGSGGGGWGGGGAGGAYSGGGAGGSWGPANAVYGQNPEGTTTITFNYLPGLVLDRVENNVLSLVQDNYSDTIQYSVNIIGQTLTMTAFREGLQTTTTLALPSTPPVSVIEIQSGAFTVLTGIDRQLTLTMAGLPATSGFLLIGSEQIKYSSTTTTPGLAINGLARGYNGTTAAAAPPASAFRQITYLTSPIGATDITLNLVSTTGWPAAGFISFATELIQYTSISGNALTGVIRGIGAPAVAHTTTAFILPCMVLTATANAGATSIVLNTTATMAATGWIQIGEEERAYTSITRNTLTLNTALANGYNLSAPVFVIYKTAEELTVPTFTPFPSQSNRCLIDSETISYTQTGNVVSNRSPPATEHTVGTTPVMYPSGVMKRSISIGMPVATVGGAVYNTTGMPVVNGQPISALGTGVYTLPAGVKKIKIVGTGAQGGASSALASGGRGARVETVAAVGSILLVGVGAPGQSFGTAGSGGGASCVANANTGDIYLLAGGGGGGYATKKGADTSAALPPPLTETFTQADPFPYAGTISYEGGGGGGGNGIAGVQEPGGAGQSFPEKGIPAVEGGSGNVILAYIEPLVPTGRQGARLILRQPAATQEIYYSFKSSSGLLLARGKDGQETETGLPAGITSVRIDPAGLVLTGTLLSGQRLSTNGELLTAIPFDDTVFEHVHVRLTGACGGSFTPDSEGGGEGAQLSGALHLVGPSLTVRTGLAGIHTEGGGGSVLTDGTGTVLIAGGGGGSSFLPPLLVADTNNKRVLLLDDLLNGSRRALTEHLSLPVSAAYDSDWNIYVLDQSYNRVAKYAGDTLAFLNYVNLSLSLTAPTALAIDGRTFYITDTKRLVVVNGDSVISVALGFQPQGVCFSETSVYVSGATNQLWKIAKDTLSSPQPLPVPSLNGPTGLFYRAGRLYICDTGNNRLVQLTPDEASIAAVYQGTLLAPQSVYVSAAAAYIYIADTGNNRIVRLDAMAETAKVYVLGSTGTGTLQFKQPLCIAGPATLKSGIGYPGGQMKASSTVSGTAYTIATLGATNWTALGATAEEPAVGDVFTRNTAGLLPSLKEGSVFNTTQGDSGGNGAAGVNNTNTPGGNGGKILSANLSVGVAPVRDNGGLWLTFLPELIKMPLRDRKVQPLKQPQFTQVKYTLIKNPGVGAFAIRGYTADGLQTLTQLTAVHPNVHTFVIHFENGVQYILRV